MSDQKQHSEEHSSLYSKDREIAPGFFLSFDAYCTKATQEHRSQICKAVTERYLRREGLANKLETR